MRISWKRAGYGVDSVADGIAGIRAAQRRLPDVVVMEVAVPSADGFEILRQLQDDASTANIPAIVVTSMLHFDVPARARASVRRAVLAPNPLNSSSCWRSWTRCW